MADGNEAKDIRKGLKVERERTQNLREIVEKQDKIRSDLEMCVEMLESTQLLLQPDKIRTSEMMPDTWDNLIKERLLFAREFVQDERQLDALRTALSFAHFTECPSEIPQIVYDALQKVVAKVELAYDVYCQAKSAISHAQAAELAHKNLCLGDDHLGGGDDEP